MSHELRTPLNAVIGFAQLLETDTDHPLAPGQLDNVRDILQAGQLLLELVNELLDLSRIESGNLKLHLEPVDLVPLVGQCVAQVRTLAAQRGIVVHVDTMACDPVLVDPLRLRDLMNKVHAKQD
jgi:signal transduction histidine kinase